MPSLFLFLWRWSFCCLNQRLRGNEVVMWLAIKVFVFGIMQTSKSRMFKEVGEKVSEISKVFNLSVPKNKKMSIIFKFSNDVHSKQANQSLSKQIVIHNFLVQNLCFGFCQTFQQTNLLMMTFTEIDILQTSNSNLSCFKKLSTWRRFAGSYCEGDMSVDSSSKA